MVPAIKSPVRLIWFVISVWLCFGVRTPFWATFKRLHDIWVRIADSWDLVLLFYLCGFFGAFGCVLLSIYGACGVGGFSCVWCLCFEVALSFDFGMEFDNLRDDLLTWHLGEVSKTYPISWGDILTAIPRSFSLKETGNALFKRGSFDLTSIEYFEATKYLCFSTPEIWGWPFL